jgi:dolichyl-phosphooligosaccharide-protein glycotransferase
MNKKIPYLPLLGLGFVIGLNIYFRSFPVNFPQLAKEARSRVESRITERSAEMVNQRYSNLSQMARDSLITAARQEYIKQNGQQVKAEIVEEYARIKDRFQDKEGQTYLFELDCWHWARYVDNIVRTGHPGDSVVNGEQRDLLMNHPQGSKVAHNMLLFYISAFLYKIASFFVRVPLNTFLFYLPLFFSAIFICALYIFCWRFYGAMAAVICSLFVGLAPIFLPRSCAGWFDMDILSQLFPLLIIFSYLQTYVHLKNRFPLKWVALSALLVGLFAFTWGYWWFGVVVVVLYEIYSVLDLFSERLQHKTDIRDSLRAHCMSLAIFLPLCVIAVLAFAGPDALTAYWDQIQHAVTLNDPLDTSVWPNVYSTVGELARPDFQQIANFIGGQYFFVLSLISMLVLVLRNKRYRGAKRESIFLFVIWFITVYAICYKGVRLIVFLLIPMGVFLGWGVREAWNYCMRRRRKRTYLLPVMGLVIVLLLGGFVNNGQRVAIGLYPMIDDAWYILLTNIKENTPSDAVINSWWDFGDWFKAIAGRPVIFDGQSQNTPQGYWMAKVFLSQSEESAMAILRMLNNGGNAAFEVIDKQLKDPVKSLLLLDYSLSVDRQTASAVLSQTLPEKTSAEVQRLLYSRPPEAYFIVDATLVGKMFPISYLGNWDVARVYVIRNLNKKSKEEIVAGLAERGLNPEAAKIMYDDARLLAPSQYNNWISHHGRFISGMIPGQQKGDIVYFNSGLMYNIKDGTMLAYNSYDGQYRVPRSLFYVEGDRLVERAYADGNMDISVLLLRDKDNYQAVQLDREFGASLFTRLFFLKGRGLKYFKPFTDTGDVQNYIGVFKIDWDAL